MESALSFFLLKLLADSNNSKYRYFCFLLDHCHYPLSSVLFLPSSFLRPLSSVLSLPSSLALPVSLSPPLFCLSLYHSAHPIPTSSSLLPSLIPSYHLPVSLRPLSSTPLLSLSSYTCSHPLLSPPILQQKIRAVTFRDSPDFLLSIKLLLQQELLRVYQIDT